MYGGKLKTVPDMTMFQVVKEMPDGGGLMLDGGEVEDRAATGGV